MGKNLIAVLGMHRSGTSALTRGLQVFGVDLGENLMPSVMGINDKGFWEDNDIVMLNEEILASLGSSWHSLAPISPATLPQLIAAGFVDRAVTMLAGKLGHAEYFGMKDPRLGKLQFFWNAVFERCDVRVRYVISLRHPQSVRDSLVKRNGFAPVKCYYLWAEHVVGALTDPQVCRSPRVLVDYDVLLAHPEAELAHVANVLGLPVDEAALADYAREFLDKNLRHAAHDPSALADDVDCPTFISELYVQLLRVARRESELDDTTVVQAIANCQARLLERESLLRLAADEESNHRHLTQEATQLQSQIAEQAAVIAERDEQLEELHTVRQKSRDRAQEIQQLKGDLKRRDAELSLLRSTLEEREDSLAAVSKALDDTRNSTSWRFTAPLRSATSSLRKASTGTRIVREAIGRQGGVLAAVRKTGTILRDEGLAGIQGRARAAARGLGKPVGEVIVGQGRQRSAVGYRPYYLSPFYEVTDADLRDAPSMGIHLHLYHEDLLDQMLDHLRNIPYDFDLYVSTRETADQQSLATEIEGKLPKARKVVVERVPNRGRDIAPFIVNFGERLKQYEIVAHLHTKKSPHAELLSNWLREILCMLYGSPNGESRTVVQIVNLLKSGAKVVYPEGSLSISVDPTGWADNYVLAGRLLRRYTQYHIEDFPSIEFPQGMMFWARGECLGDFLSLPLTLEDFPEEPILPDGTIAHALERIVLIMMTRFEGTCVRLHARDIGNDYPFYEEQQDYSGLISSDAPKVLSYYLPQFHPTPDNDEWHGKGFTEWTKVRATNPLFEEHYQQHIPHPDLGYYLLDSPAMLQKQADIMKKAGVHGQVFYHYWFGGRLILEKPVRMLLENSQVDMPFCFCWANENWTRRWDGNEREILLGQNYSAEDAVAFIEYLIPFFRDERYIKVDGRPLLFVYRASAIPDPDIYVQAWAQTCLAHGIPEPYTVTVLTRGATDPRDFGMDAATERVLHDWTGGAAPDISSGLTFYENFNGSVLRYDDVANAYIAEDPERPFTWFRNAVPIWDNTARYGSEAYVVHDSSPKKFQEWMQVLVEQSMERQPNDRRFILVNAWNEWAEGAHLEPDTKHGYAYLNSVGRALSCQPYGTVLTGESLDLAGTVVEIEVASLPADALVVDDSLRRRFLRCLANSTLFRKCRVRFTKEHYAELLTEMEPTVSIDRSTDPAPYKIVVGNVSFFTPDALEALVRTGMAYKTAVVVANTYDGDTKLVRVAEDATVDRTATYGAAFALYPAISKGDFKIFKLCPPARCVVTYPELQHPPEWPVVTTIIRIHGKGELRLLENALLSLLAQKGCHVRPLVAAQDYSDSQKAQLEKLLATYPWHADCAPVIRYFDSPGGVGDLRSVMMNESLKSVRSGYAAFLDYDDLMFPDAYARLIGRLQRTGKAVAFGRVFVAVYDTRLETIVERRRVYEYGHSYHDFRLDNHAPIHSFLLDMSKIDVQNIIYYADQRYMEDYLMTLQIFTANNADWEALSNPDIYVGDYIHSADRAHTLAILDGESRAELLQSEEYVECKRRVADIRKKTVGR
ncbi:MULTISPECIES: glycoside hydrolase family 99-like domain-containing protein [unclassified Achromobacter]|uniref:glycoside hydrolase family 99-like domain-containing protein n=1 Tax=unclassified Achromobacter TaxID=2626865 RepID=UPI000B51B98A|nr:MULTISPECIES: glycoside hydrolase family 99-like domain-containing protein [unclassified Achromobacter]OWT74959.1 hypothetical protein CEY04_20550 [Achromobacter sp. HZ28]OWT76567.1 hypothetical protein CEY05_16005 [Achromobacter sp. HZ34]